MTSETEPIRRRDDERIEALVLDVADLKVSMQRNTEVTEQVRDVLASFRVAAAISKWGAAMMAGALAFYHGWDVWKK